MRSLEDTKDLRVGTRLKALMMGAGLVDVDVRMIPLPLSAWSGGKCTISFLLLTIAAIFLTLLQIHECEKLAWQIEKTPSAYFQRWHITL